MHEVVGLIAFAFAGSVSPGPNNTLLWASGMSFGLRRTVPHVVGTSFGIGALFVAMAVGIGAVLDAVPALETGLKVVGSVYLVAVAYLVLVSGAIGQTDVSRPLGLWQAVGFQFVNPKAWIFAIAAVGTFFPARVHPVRVAVLTATVMGVVIASASIWAAGGAALARVVENERTLQVVRIVLAALLIASVALIWI
jgi:threonine/homoserine/homoserine lactone efflux protein